MLLNNLVISFLENIIIDLIRLCPHSFKKDFSSTCSVKILLYSGHYLTSMFGVLCNEQPILPGFIRYFSPIPSVLIHFLEGSSQE